MQSRTRRSGILLLFLSSHPGPSVAVAAICVALGVTTLSPWRSAVVGLAVLFGQFSVGLSNDWLDAARDRAVGRTDKPVAKGELGEVAVRNAAIVAGIAGLLLTLLVGIPATIAHTLFLAAGWAYNLGLKNSAVSVLPFIVGFGVLPAVVTLARSGPEMPSWWAVSAGAMLGVAAHFANALPDLEQDRATGIVGLPHRLGAHASSLFAFAAIAAATVIIVAGSGMGTVIFGWVTLATEGLIVAAGITLSFVRPGDRALLLFVILGALIAVVLLVLSGSQFAS